MLRRRHALLLVLSVLGVFGCARATPSDDAAIQDEAPAGDAAPRPRVVILGDSLTAGLGLAADRAFPAVLQQRLDAAGYHVEVVNAGVSGDTTAGGLRRLDWALDGNVRVLVVALGANDGLRGLPVDAVKRNLDAIVRRAKAREAQVVLAGMEAPPNLGARYTSEFREAFRAVAREQDIAFVPFLLEGVAGMPSLNQADGIHPNAEGTRRIVDVLWPAIEPALAARLKPGATR